MQSYDMEEVFRAIVYGSINDRDSDNYEKVTRAVSSKKFKPVYSGRNKNSFNIEQIKNEVYARTYGTFSSINF